jgi:hypothetical protein
MEMADLGIFARGKVKGGEEISNLLQSYLTDLSDPQRL